MQVTREKIKANKNNKRNTQKECQERQTKRLQNEEKRLSKNWTILDDILIATIDKGMLYEVKQFISKNFDMKDMGETYYVIGIKIHRERSWGILGLSKETYTKKKLERFKWKIVHQV